jgi:hypothetical protein
MAEKPPPAPPLLGPVVPVPILLPVPPEPTLVAIKVPPGAQKVTEKLAAAPPRDSCALPPPPPLSATVTWQPLTGALKFPTEGETMPRPLPTGSSTPPVKVCDSRNRKSKIIFCAINYCSLKRGYKRGKVDGYHGSLSSYSLYSLYSLYLGVPLRETFRSHPSFSTGSVMNYCARPLSSPRTAPRRSAPHPWTRGKGRRAFPHYPLAPTCLADCHPAPLA